MSKQPQPRSRSNPQPRSRPVVPALPSKTGTQSGGCAVTTRRRSPIELKRAADFAVEPVVLPYQPLWLISAFFSIPMSRLCSTLSCCDRLVSWSRLLWLWPRREYLWNGRCLKSLGHDRDHYCDHCHSGFRFHHGREQPCRHDRCSVHCRGRYCWHRRSDPNHCGRRLYRRRGHRHYHHLRFRPHYHHRYRHHHHHHHHRLSHRRSS